jgi:hypothetical protein
MCRKDYETEIGGQDLVRAVELLKKEMSGREGSEGMEAAPYILIAQLIG